MAKKSRRAAARARAAQKAAREMKKAAAAEAAAAEKIHRCAASAAQRWNTTLPARNRARAAWGGAPVRRVTPSEMERRIAALLSAKREGLIA